MPTTGSACATEAVEAGVVPAVIRYWLDHVPGASIAQLDEFLLTAAAVGGLIKHNASISGAECGCQAEVGSASAMAAAGLCAVMGGDMVYETVRKHLGLDGEGTTEDGAFTLERVECNAACDFAPVMMLNWEFMDNMTPRKAIEIIEKLRNDEEVHSTRGPQITSWRDNERVLAGFNDGRGNDGPAAGHSSLAGWRIANNVKEGE